MRCAQTRLSFYYWGCYNADGPVLDCGSNNYFREGNRVLALGLKLSPPTWLRASKSGGTDKNSSERNRGNF